MLQIMRATLLTAPGALVFVIVYRPNAYLLDGGKTERKKKKKKAARGRRIIIMSTNADRVEFQ